MKKYSQAHPASFVTSCRGLKRFFVFAFALLFIGVLARESLATVQAYILYREPLRAQEISRSDFSHSVLVPGEEKEFTITYKNVGTRSWYKEGPNRVALNTIYPLPRRSPFQHESWTEWYRPTKLPLDEVKPGETATFSFKLKAPETPGEYIERFALVGLPEGMVQDADFGILITVGQTPPPIPLFRAKVISISPNAQEPFKPGESKTLWVEYENTGRAPWTNPARSSIALETAKPRLRESDFAYRWKTPGHANYLRESRINPGERVKIFFALEAPETPGTYVESFQLVAQGLLPMARSEVNLSLTVSQQQVAEASEKPKTVIEEPTIRVGITYLNGGIDLKPTTSHIYKTTEEKELYKGSANEQSTITYASGTYTLHAGGKQFTSQEPIRVYPDNDGVTAVVNYRTNYDTFRGIMEVRYATATGRLWVINELPFEQYMAGLAEAVNGQHPEYMKTLAVAARSYALWHYYVSTRHRNENYTINSTTDQVYKGYFYEQKTQDFVDAVRATRGIVMTHPSAGFERNPLNIALGAYSSGTDGRTRNFTDVFGGKPEDWEWMVSVDDPLGIIPDALTRPGNHMVGMSATGALRYAVREGKTYDWILKHYYSGVALQALY